MTTWDEDTEWRNPVFSLAERDRRWALVRGKMAAQGMAAIVCLTSGAQYRMAHVRYLTQLDDGEEDTAVVFPLEGEPTVWSGREGLWPSGNWLKEVRGREGRFWGRNAGKRLKELGLDSATIGVAGLKGSPLADGRNPEGQTGYGPLMALKEQVPSANVVDATELLGECRYIKSAEEIAFIEKGTEIAEATLNAMVQTSRPGVAERDVFAAMLEVYLRLGGTFPTAFGWTTGPAGNMYHRIEQPTLRKLHAGDMLMPEIVGRYAGYWAQIDPTVAVGQVPQEFLDANKLAVESFNGIVAAMKPGATVAELIKAGQGSALGGRLEARVGAHGRGLGDDGPLIVERAGPKEAALVLQEGVCLAVKPSVTLDGKEAGRFGDSVVVTATGARRLGTRTQELMHAG